MMKQKYYLSPYHYNLETEMQIVQNKKPKKVDIRGNEAAIIRALALYRLLNKSCITIHVNRMQPPERQKPNHDTEIHNLFQGGYIRRYEYPSAINGRQNVVLYALTEKGVEYALKKQMRFSGKPLTDDKRYSTATALEITVLNVWHTRLLDCYSEYIKTDIYEAPIRILEDKNSVIASCIGFENEEWSLLKSFSIAAIPFCKEYTEQTEGTLINSIMAANVFFKNNKRVHKKPFIIILTESFAQMEKADAMIHSYQILQKLQVYYALDEYVNDKNPLKWLYEVIRDEKTGDTKFIMIDLTQKQKEERS